MYVKQERKGIFMNHPIHTEDVFNSIGIWLSSVFAHPNSIVVKDNTLVWQQIIFYKQAIAKEYLDYLGETSAINYAKFAQKIGLWVLEKEKVYHKLSDEEYQWRRDAVIANAQWRLELAEEGKTIEEIQQLERKIEFEHMAQSNINQESINPQLMNLTPDAEEEEYNFGTYLKRLEEKDKVRLVNLFNCIEPTKSIEQDGILVWLLFKVKRYLQTEIAYNLNFRKGNFYKKNEGVSRQNSV
ncbi:hypothetical protein HW132_27885 [Brasilonema sp. CT11]|nr:hypothetical protein [Brasilonema sp. CT11]